MIFYPFFLLGKFDFESISKSILRLLRIAKTKMQINIVVQHQYAFRVASQTPSYRYGYRYYIFYMLEEGTLYPKSNSFYAKLEKGGFRR